MKTEQRLNGGSPDAKIYAITSGKGGVGKTSIALNLSIILARAGMRVLLIDADIGLANVYVMTGIATTRSIEDVISGEVSIFDVLVEGPEGLTILPSASALGDIKEFQDNIAVFKKELLKLENAFDMIFIDTGAGISANVVDFIFMADEVIVIMTPEPTAFADAYALVKLLSLEKPQLRMGIIINIMKKEEDAEKLYVKFNEIVKRFLGKELRFRGFVPEDKTVADAVMRQIPLAVYSGNSPSMKAIRNIAGNLLGIKTTKKRSLFSR